MPRFRLVLLNGIALLLALRCVCFLTYAWFVISNPLELFHFEAVMVNLAHRVSLGQPLYPDWAQPPHFPNFYGPLAFWLVGLLGRYRGVGLEGLFGIGRAVSLICSMLTSLLVGLYIMRKYGRVAGILAMSASLGAAPMFGFSVMVRPDALAETLGFAGFGLGGGRSVRRIIAGGVVLALAILAKQTAAVFLLATLAALASSQRPRDSLVLLGSCLAALILIAAVMSLAGEPRLVAGLLGQARFAPSLHGFRLVVDRLAELSPDLLVLPLIGLCFWGLGKPRELDLAAFTVVVVAVSLASAIKPGSDLNYFLSLRVVEALAIGKLREVTRTRKGQLAPGPTLALAIAFVSLLPGIQLAFLQAQHARTQAGLIASPQGQAIVQTQRELFRMAADPALHVLTDSGMVALHQGDRAAFADPWMFRALVNSGQIDPRAIETTLNQSGYDYLILSALLGPSYDSYVFGLPPRLARVAESRYVLLGNRGGLFLYGPIVRKRR